MKDVFDFIEIEQKIIELNHELEKTVMEYQELLVKLAEKKNEYKKEFAKAYLKYRVPDDEPKKITDTFATQKATLDTIDLLGETEVLKALADATYEKIQQIKLEIDSLRSILSAYKETYERTI